MSAFLQRVAAAFGAPQALLLRIAGLSEAEWSAEGAWITDRSGRRWLDFGSFGLHLLGHRHPAIVAAATDQLGRMGLSSKMLGNDAATACAERLKASVPCPMDGVIFGNSGAEAIESALRLARISTGRQRVLALRGSYHGRTAAALAISDAIGRNDLIVASALTVFIEPGNIAAAEVALAGRDICAVVVEPIQGEGGIVAIDPAFLRALATLSRAVGSLLVVDEVQTGLGRCGEVWIGADPDLSPDVVVAGKVLGGGIVPISAAIYSRRHVQGAAVDPVIHASTFAGAPFAAHIAATVLDLVTRQEFLATVRRFGAYAVGELSRTLRGLPGLRAVRGRGLMIGLDFASSDLAGEVVLEAARRGVLVTFCLSRPNVVRFYPPAVVTEAELEEGITRLNSAIRHAVERCHPAPTAMTGVN
jgi:acetylornithine/succinyldiaminopimelate/putrescine aminotransferase